MRIVRHALNLANGPAIIEATAKCHVQHPAIDYPAMNVAQSVYYVVINVRVFTVKNILQNTVSNAV